jgi:Tol biopolymer transport system component
MALDSGTRLGPYEILAQIGAGGMGEVYRAHDAKLNRDVALKVLPAALADDAERLARFRREAQVLAALNHPHIAQIYGFEDSGATHALVMELVEGPTLAERIAGQRAEGSGLPVPEILAIARQIADALEAAHEQGIVHRDLKPANIKVKADGTVKVLDFGLAKALEPVGAGGPGEAGAITHSPTITTPAMTLRGVILGTAAYMSPEQARGKTIDKRTDIWAFGCVLFEMLTGAQAFGGETISDAIASVLAKDPNWTALPASTLAPVRRLLSRCLERDVKRRLHDIADARLDIEEALAHPELGTSDSAVALRTPVTRPLVGVVAVVALLIGAVGAGVALRGRSAAGAPAPEVVRFTVSLPPGPTLTQESPAAALSPNGRHLVIVGREDATDGASSALFLRTAGDIAVRKIRGTERSIRPFFSPDGRWIGFFRYAGNALLMKIPIDGGAPVTIARVNGTSGLTFPGADWGADGTIVFAHRSGISAFVGLSRVSASGGTPTELLAPDIARGEEYGWPQWLPDGEHVLFSIRRPAGQADAVAVLSIKTGQKRVVVENATYGRLAPTGHLLFVRGGDLLTVTFDKQRLEASGEPIVVQTGIGYQNGSRSADLTLAASGTAAMIFRGNTASTGASSLVWVDRQGEGTPAAALERGFRQPMLSPDGQRLLVDIDDGNGRDIWLYDFRRSLLSRLTTSGGETPLWSPDGLSVAWPSSAEGKSHVVIRRVDGSDAEKRIWSTDEHIHLNAWAPDGRSLLLNATHGQRQDLVELTLEPQIRARPFLESKFNEYGAAISPDGHRVAFVSDQSGQPEVYLTTRGGVGRVQVSSGGGAEPVWSHDGREVFYRSATRLMGVAIRSDAVLEVGASQLLFDGLYVGGGRDSRDPGYAVSPDGHRFLMLRPAANRAAGNEVVVTLNWLEELKRLAPIAKN